MYTDVITALETQLKNTITLLEGFTEEEINKIPFEGSWTAGQVGEHLRKVSYKTDKVLLAAAEAAGREPDERAAEFKNIFLNYDSRFTAPVFVDPESKAYEKQRLINALTKAKNAIINAAYKAGLTRVAPLPSQHPLAGITKLELLYFLTYHTQRHNYQLEKIKEMI